MYNKEEFKNENCSYIRKIFQRPPNRTIYRRSDTRLQGVRAAQQHSHSRYLHRQGNDRHKRQPRAVPEDAQKLGHEDIDFSVSEDTLRKLFSKVR